MSASESRETRHSIASAMIDGISHMSTLPEVTLRIVDVIDDPTSSARDLHQIIVSDPALSARILKVVNSSFYGMPRQIGSMNRAISLLGLNAIKNIAVAASLGRMFRGASRIPGLDPRHLWDHSLDAAVATCMIARASGSDCTEEAFLAGLLHDIGLMVEFQHDPALFADMIGTLDLGPDGTPDSDLRALEVERFGVEHQELGALLCQRWKFPKSLVSSTGNHHDPGVLRGDDAMMSWFVHVGDRIAARSEPGFRMDLPDLEISLEACDAIGVGPTGIRRVLEALAAEGREIRGSLAA
ncbi:MAG: HDOD domain-containing protein [Planctomycetota bacterium]|nr:HDOD domain-containing protein [Planctomycetota bacterium]